MKKLVGKVTEEERNEIQALFERRNGLRELAQVLTTDNDELYNRLVNDMGENTSLFQGWWNRMSKKYNWEGTEDGHWEIDFKSCEIYLLTP